MIVSCDSITFIEDNRYTKCQKSSYNRIVLHGLDVVQFIIKLLISFLVYRIGEYVQHWWRWVRSGVMLRGWNVVSVFAVLNSLKQLAYHLNFLKVSHFSDCT
jgi:hypothetical protein